MMTDGLHPFRRWLMPVALGLIVVSSQGCRSGGGGESNPEFEESEVEHVEHVDQVHTGQTELEPEAPSGPVTSSRDAKTAAPKSSTAKPSGTTKTAPKGRPGDIDAQGPIALIGLNVAGAEFTSSALPGKEGTHYFFPPKQYFDRWAEKGITSVRFPIKWERLQPKLKGKFDEVYAGHIDAMLDQAEHNYIDILLDVHNYARYRGDVIGTKNVPVEAFEDLLSRIAQRWGGHPALYAYDIMNEPYGADDKWPAAAQAGINGVRKHDTQKPIFIEGTSWSSAARWPKYGDALLELKDPSDNLVFSAHVYLDPDASGSYKQTHDKFDPMVGVNRVKPFVNWLKKNYKRGHIGEFGVPNDPKYLKAMDNMLGYLQENCIPVSYWAAGPSWGNYKLSVEPGKDGKEKAQWNVLKKYIDSGNCTDFGPLP